MDCLTDNAVVGGVDSWTMSLIVLWLVEELDYLTDRNL